MDDEREDRYNLIANQVCKVLLAIFACVAGIAWVTGHLPQHPHIDGGDIVCAVVVGALLIEFVF
jgi:hypothetical protein